VELLFSSLAFSYLVASAIVILLWGVNIYKNAQARIFAKNELDKLIGGSMEPQKQERRRIEELLYIDGARLRTSDKSSLVDWREFEFEIVSAYLLRQNLKIDRNALLEAIKTFADADIPKNDALIKEAIVSRASSGGALMKYILVESYRSQFQEVGNIVRRLRGSRREHSHS
jgi:hypothetical protein